MLLEAGPGRPRYVLVARGRPCAPEVCARRSRREKVFPILCLDCHAIGYSFCSLRPTLCSYPQRPTLWRCMSLVTVVYEPPCSILLPEMQGAAVNMLTPLFALDPSFRELKHLAAITLTQHMISALFDIFIEKKMIT